MNCANLFLCILACICLIHILLPLHFWINNVSGRFLFRWIQIFAQGFHGWCFTSAPLHKSKHGSESQVTHPSSWEGEQDSDVDLSEFGLYLPFTQSACGLCPKFPGLWYHQMGYFNGRLIIVQETNWLPLFPVKIPTWPPSLQRAGSENLDWVRIDLLDREALCLVISPAPCGQALPCYQVSIQHVLSDTSEQFSAFWHCLPGDSVKSHKLSAHCPPAMPFSTQVVICASEASRGCSLEPLFGFN